MRGRQHSEASNNGILYPVPPCLNHTFKVMTTKEVGETHVDLHASILATWMATIIYHNRIIYALNCSYDSRNSSFLIYDIYCIVVVWPIPPHFSPTLIPLIRLPFSSSAGVVEWKQL